MIWANQTVITKFILLGFSELLHFQLLLFVVLLVFYIIIMLRNTLIILITIIDPCLFSPVYYFLQNLPFLAIFFSLVVVPKLLVILMSKNKCVLLWVHYAGVFAIFANHRMFLPGCHGLWQLCPCNPLCYTVIMNRRFSFQLVVASWISGIPVGIVQTMWLFSFPFCGHNEINHFCDGPPVLVLVCADTSLFHIYSNTATFLIVISPFVLILASYTCILCTVLKMQSLNGKHKAFSTCSSHLMVLTLLYITFSLTYIQYKTKYWPNTNKILSFSYTAITLMLNPIIYSMRNNIVKGALRRTLSRVIWR